MTVWTDEDEGDGFPGGCCPVCHRNGVLHDVGIRLEYMVCHDHKVRWLHADGSAGKFGDGPWRLGRDTQWALIADYEEVEPWYPGITEAHVADQKTYLELNAELDAREKSQPAQD
jgi:hypothetical protein